jgi:hypothetical protein
VERLWWQNVLRVLTRPRDVFAGFREDPDEAAEARAEPVNAIVVLAGIAAVSWAPATGSLLEDPEIDSILVAVLLLLTGAIYGAVAYFGLGLLLRVGLATVGISEPARRGRQLLAYAAVPVALSVVLLPLRLALYGRAIFERDGEGAPNAVLGVLQLGAIAWSVVLLVIGLRVAFGLPWVRAAAAAILPALVPAVAVAGILL